MNKGIGLMTKIALGFVGMIFIMSFFVYLPNMNITILGLDFTTMDSNTLWMFRIGLFLLAFISLFWGALDSAF